jgi:ribonuclease P protein subunit POP4
LEGIIVRDTRFTFEIITKNNSVKCKSSKQDLGKW